MNQQNIRNLTLFDLLARNWQCAASVDDLRFSSDGANVAFACADGTVALATISDPEPPETRIRMSADVGRATIQPRQKEPEPLVTTPRLHDGAPPLAHLRGPDFLVGTSAGSVLHLGGDGQLTDTNVNVGAPIVAIDHAVATGMTAATDGGGVFLSRGPGDLSTFSPADGSEIVAVAFSPAGRHLAVAGAGGLSIWTMDPGAAWLCEFGLPGRPVSLSWNGDGQWLACTLDCGGFLLVDLFNCRAGIVGDFPVPTRSASWSRPTDTLLASGAYRIAAWSMQTPPFDGDNAGALVSGRAGLVVVDSVAAHPTKPLAAAGYANGQIVVAQIGGRDELLVKPSGGGVTVLAWSPDGRHLAAGTTDGAASIITFPPQIFK